MYRAALLVVVWALVLAPTGAQAASFDLNFAAPNPDCPREDPGCGDLEDVVPTGPPNPMPDPMGAPFLSYEVGGRLVTGAAWLAFTGQFDDSFVFGQMRQDLDFRDGGLGVDGGLVVPVGTDNIDATESVALFVDVGATAFELSDVVLGNHPGDPFDDTDSFLLWYTANPDVFAPWQSLVAPIEDAGLAVASLGLIYGVAFEAIEGESIFYLSAAAGQFEDVIPEPSTALLLGIGLLGLAARRAPGRAAR